MWYRLLIIQFIITNIMDSNFTATISNAPIGNKKINMVAKMVRGKKVTEVLQFLHYMPTKSAKILYKLIASAMANATTNGDANAQDLIVDSIEVGRGRKFKRMRFV